MRTSVDLCYFQDWSPFILILELHPIRPNEDLGEPVLPPRLVSFIFTLELNPIRPNKDLCGPVLPPELVSLHPYLGTPPNEAQ